MAAAARAAVFSLGLAPETAVTLSRRRIWPPLIA